MLYGKCLIYHGIIKATKTESLLMLHFLVSAMRSDSFSILPAWQVPASGLLTDK